MEGYARESSQCDKCYPAVIDTRKLITHSTLMLIDTVRPGSAALDRSGREMALRLVRPGKQMARVSAGGFRLLKGTPGFQWDVKCGSDGHGVTFLSLVPVSSDIHRGGRVALWL